MLAFIVEEVKKIFKTKNDLLVMTVSGTGVMEAAIANTLSPGDKVVIVEIGSFGERFSKIATAYGLDVLKLQFELGKAADPKKLEEILDLDKNKNIKAVLFQQNETSTGVLNDVEALAKVVKKHGALIIVDAVSGMAVADLKTDEWGIDVVVAGSQKAFMVPPGLGFVSVSEKAWKANETAKCPNFYLSFKQAKDFASKGETPWTPAVSIIYGLNASLEILKKEGLENIYKRHYLLRDAVRAGIKALGLKLLAADSDASPAVTAVFPPDGVEADTFRKTVKDKFGVVLAGGQGKLKGKIFRIGHLGFADKLDAVVALAAIEMTLKELGQKVELGKGVAAAEEVLAK
jgi:aspartate aminotransferase-like enzyme